MPPAVIANPILPGFHPDPSIVRTNDGYYLATSTFEWFPGIRLHHSRDLVTWTPIGHALTDPAQLDLRDVPDSGGVWAPSLSYHDGRFWLVFAVIRDTTGPFKDLGRRRRPGCHPRRLLVAPFVSALGNAARATRRELAEPVGSSRPAAAPRSA